MIANIRSRSQAFLGRVQSASRQQEVDDGVASVDSLLSELNPHESRLLDAALDLRAVVAERANATACLEQMFRVRTLLDGRHSSAFDRARIWMSRTLGVEVRTERGAPWIRFQISANSARIEEIANTALARIAHGDLIPRAAEVRFVFSNECAPSFLE